MLNKVLVIKIMPIVNNLPQLFCLHLLEVKVEVL